LGLGQLKKHSELNQPFNATIDLVDASAAELDTLRVKLADAERFRRAGIERPHLLSQLRFEVVETSSGPDFIKITSKVPIQEPYLNFLIEVSWSNGTLFREYAALLDPPVYGRVTQGGARPPVPAPAKVTPLRASGSDSGKPASAARAATPGSYGPTVNGDTLWEIALQARGDRGLSVQQVMIALLRANPDAFFRDNINALRAGVVLNVPDASTIAAISRSEAAALTSQQGALWEQYRGQVAARPAQAPIGQASSAGERGDRVVQPTAGAAADAELKLLAANTASATGGDALRQELGAAQETVTSQKQEIGELSSKLTEADEIIKLLRRQIDVKDAELAALQAKVASGSAAGVPAGAAAMPPVTPGTAEAAAQPEGTGAAPVDEAPSAADGAPQTEEASVGAEAPASPATAAGATEAPASPTPDTAAPDTTAEGSPALTPPAPAETAAASEGRILEAIPGGAATLGVAIAAVLGLAALLLRRRRAAEVAPIDDEFAPSEGRAEPWDSGAAGGRSSEDETVARVRPVLDEVTGPVAALDIAGTTPPAVSEAEEDDPLSDINVYLAYERFDEAEQVVKQAIAAQPDEHKLKLKLLEVYYAAGNNAAFEQSASELQSAVGGTGPLWHSALAMWQAMSPERALFAPGAEAAPAVPSSAAREFIDISAIGDTQKLPPAVLASVLPATTGARRSLDVLDLDFTGFDTETEDRGERVTDLSTGHELEWDGGGLGTAEPGAGTVSVVDLGADGSGEADDSDDVLDLTMATALNHPAILGSTVPQPSMRSVGSSHTASVSELRFGTVPDAGSALDVDLSLGSATQDERGHQEERGSRGSVEATSKVTFKLPGGSDLGRVPGSIGGSKIGETIDLGAPVWTQGALGSGTAAARSTSPVADGDRGASMGGSSMGLDLEPRERTVEDSVEFDLGDIDLEVVESQPPGVVDISGALDSSGFELTKASSIDLSLGSFGTIEQGEGLDHADFGDGAVASEVDVKLNLAKAYIELGDADGARAILQEVTEQGTAAERDEAAQLLAQIA
jgi:pilus assembly protein FimV